MKNKLKLFTLSVMFLFTFSCNNDESIKTEESLLYKTESSAIMTKQYNYIGNPYESVGQFHNSFLDYYFESDNSDEISDIAELAVSFYKDQNNTNPLDYIQYPNIIADVNYSINNTVSETINKLNNQGVISNVTKNYLNQIFDILSAAEASGDINNFINEVENIEEEMLEADLNDADKKILLPVISVAKYSSNYWNEVYISLSASSPNGKTDNLLRAKQAIHIAGVDLNAQITASIWAGPFAGIIASSASAKEAKRIGYK
ncbi:hypothetical protein [Chryseobacterium shigense]|uniref:Uncharacterized protein n=1 Tax=Chryseobacterium shigense TaxID=297244 RepID=A0A841N5C6_9FLAO|nr:hypothetical protein [Chryseobacterium shigense]MBB6370323.1 hypothetical protein [Chryseobacterium shigense]